MVFDVQSLFAKCSETTYLFIHLWCNCYDTTMVCFAWVCHDVSLHFILPNTNFTGEQRHFQPQFHVGGAVWHSWSRWDGGSES